MPPPPPPLTGSPQGFYHDDPRWNNFSPRQGGQYNGRPETNTLALVSLIAGIVGLAFMCLYGFGGVFSIVAVVTGTMAKKQPLSASDEGKVKAGLITGWIGVGLAVLIVILVILAVVVGVSMDSTGIR